MKPTIRMVLYFNSTLVDGFESEIQAKSSPEWFDQHYGCNGIAKAGLSSCVHPVGPANSDFRCCDAAQKVAL